MKTAENIKKVALLFFIVLGSTHIVSGLMVSNNVGMPVSLILNRSLDIPFAMTALIYGLGTIYTGLREGKHKAANIIFALITILIFLLLLYINLLIPDKTAITA